MSEVKGRDNRRAPGTRATWSPRGQTRQYKESYAGGRYEGSVELHAPAWPS